MFLKLLLNMCVYVHISVQSGIEENNHGHPKSSERYKMEGRGSPWFSKDQLPGKNSGEALF